MWNCDPRQVCWSIYSEYKYWSPCHFSSWPGISPFGSNWMLLFFLGSISGQICNILQQLDLRLSSWKASNKHFILHIHYDLRRIWKPLSRADIIFKRGVCHINRKVGNVLVSFDETKAQIQLVQTWEPYRERWMEFQVFCAILENQLPRPQEHYSLLWHSRRNIWPCS